MSLKVIAVFLLGLCAVAMAGHKMAPAPSDSSSSVSSMGGSGLGGASGIPFGQHIRLQLVGGGPSSRVARSPSSHSSKNVMGSQGSMSGANSMMGGPAPVDAIIVPFHDHSAAKQN